MKKGIILTLGVLALFASCQKEDISGFDPKGNEVSSVIEFRDYVGTITRASRKVGDTFVNGDKIDVWGYQITSEVPQLLFKNQEVSKVEGQEIWQYSPAKYWNSISTYDFYAMFPYGIDHSFDTDVNLFSVGSYTVNDNTDDQVDIMIASRKKGMPPYNTVDFEFNHILSNVNFYFKASSQFKKEDISSFELLTFDITDIKSTGAYTQSGWNENDAPVGAWTVEDDKVYDFPGVTAANPVEYVTGNAKATDIAADLLLMPQTISKDAKITLSYRINYTDGTSQTMNRETLLKNIIGTNKKNESAAIVAWKPNFIYNYTVSVDPSKKYDPNGTDQADKDDEEHPSVIIVIPVDTNNDGEPDEYWIDDDCDGEPDYPTVWDDPDGDGIENLYPDHDGNGIPDYRDDDDPHTGDTDGDGIPDDVWVDKDHDGESETEIWRKVGDVDPELPTDPTDPNYPDKPYIDYDGGVDGYQVPGAYLVEDANGDLWIDTDGDGNGDIKVLWKDIDGDGKLEGIADKDGDGVLTPADTYDGDGKDYLGNDNDYDVIMWDKDKDGVCEKELEREIEDGNEDDIEDDPTSNKIQFSATVTEWEDEINASYSVFQ